MQIQAVLANSGKFSWMDSFFERNLFEKIEIQSCDCFWGFLDLPECAKICILVSPVFEQYSEQGFFQVIVGIPSGFNLWIVFIVLDSIILNCSIDWNKDLIPSRLRFGHLDKASKKIIK